MGDWNTRAARSNRRLWARAPCPSCHSGHRTLLRVP